MSNVRVWNEPPPMETGAPLPAIRVIGDRLLVAYICSNPDFPGWDSGTGIDHPGFVEYMAILEFGGVEKFTLGPPSDEKLCEHPLYEFGLNYYQFHEVTNDLEKNPSRWVITFHDETLDVIASYAKVLYDRVEGEGTDAILTPLL